MLGKLTLSQTLQFFFPAKQCVFKDVLKWLAARAAPGLQHRGDTCVEHVAVCRTSCHLGYLRRAVCPREDTVTFHHCHPFSSIPSIKCVLLQGFCWMKKDANANNNCTLAIIEWSLYSQSMVWKAGNRRIYKTILRRLIKNKDRIVLSQ